MRTMQIGKLNKRVTMLRITDHVDAFGQKTKKLTKLATVWADFYPVRGTEVYESQKIEGRMTHKCYIRWSPVVADLSSNDFLSYGGKTYSIDSVINVDFDNKMLEIYCTEYVNKEGMARGS